MVQCFDAFLCSVVLVRDYFSISVQDTRKLYFVIYQLAILPPYLYAGWYYSLQEDSWFSTILTKPILSPYPP